jgi:colicin import membrane protein
VLAARGSAEAAAYRSLIQARIQRAWIRPPGAQAGINCEVRVTQVPGGTVTGVQITRCNGDQTVRESIEAAVNRASPLPIPSNPDLFDRNLVITFHPDDAQ